MAVTDGKRRPVGIDHLTVVPAGGDEERPRTEPDGGTDADAVGE